MRKIKFRGKRLDNGEWVYGNLILWNNRAFVHYEELSSRNKWREVAPETVGQYTELKDKNGVEIYEGDICRDSLGWIFEVVWDNDIGTYTFLRKAPAPIE